MANKKNDELYNGINGAAEAAAAARDQFTHSSGNFSPFTHSSGSFGTDPAVKQSSTASAIADKNAEKGWTADSKVPGGDLNKKTSGGTQSPTDTVSPSGNGGGGTGTGGTGSNPSGGNPTAPKEWAGPTVESYYDPATDAAYQSALAALQTAQGNAPTYPGTYDAQLVDMYNTIVNRDPFKYDLNADMLYQQYAQQYVNKGRLAMMDTMGQAAGLTGGYGSSYGQMVGQQAYNSYLQELNNMIPEFYDRAYQQYADEGDWLLKQYQLLGDLSDTEYARYSDDYNRWLNERDYAQDLADQAYSRGYKEFEDRYNRGLDDAAFRAKVGDFGGYEDYYGEMVADRMQNNWLAANPDAAYRNGLMTPEEYNALTGSWPAGYTPPNSGGYYYGGGGNSEEEPTAESGSTDQKNYYVDVKNQLQTWKSDGWTNAEVNNKLQELVNGQYITSTDKQKLYNLYRGR